MELADYRGGNTNGETHLGFDDSKPFCDENEENTQDHEDGLLKDQEMLSVELTSKTRKWISGRLCQV